MTDTLPDGAVRPAPRQESEFVSGGSPAWSHTVIDDPTEAAVFAAFRVVAGAGVGRIFDLKSSGDTRIGRDAALNDVVITDTRASAQQMIVRSKDGEFGVIDLGSTNGTFVNGEQVLAPVALRSDDRVSIGDTVMVFHFATAE